MRTHVLLDADVRALLCTAPLIVCCSRGCFSGKTQRGCVSARARSESPVAKQVQAHLASVCCCVTVLNHCLLATRPSSSSSSSSTRPSFKVRVLLLPLSGEPFPGTLISHPPPPPPLCRSCLRQPCAQGVAVAVVASVRLQRRASVLEAEPMDRSWRRCVCMRVYACAIPQ